MQESHLLKEYQTYRGRDEVPVDFDDFWDGLLREVKIPKEYELVEKNFGLKNVDCYELIFTGTNHGQIYARIVLPKDANKVPVIFHFHGYMGRCWDWSDMLSFTVAGYGVVTMDVRGQSGYSIDGSGSVRGNTVKGQIIRGAVEGPSHLFYKDVYLDLYTLVEIVAAFPRVDEQNLSSYGASQGGALALVCAALNPRIQQTVAIYPFLLDFRRVLEMGNTSEAYDELFRYFKFHDPFHETKDQLLQVLSYIDVKNMAHRIKGRVRLIIALADDVCPPITQFALYNRLECDKDYRLLPEYGHEDLPVFVHDCVYNWLCGTQIATSFLFDRDFNPSLETTFRNLDTSHKM